MAATDKTGGKTALVIGATGSVGGEVAAALLARGWRVRGLHRDPVQAARAAVGLARIEWVKGDAMSAADVLAAAQGVQAIVHGANPPGYKDWAGLAVPMLEAAIAAAKATGARIVFPGNVYNYGPDAFPRMAEDAPQNPSTRKGAIRVAMERRLAEAGVRTIVVRAGDFFGPISGSSWLTEGLVAKDRPLRSVSYPGPRGIAHAWAYLPDLAQTMVRLLEMEAELPDFAVYHHAGHVLTGDEMIAALERVAGRRLAVKAFPWLALRALAPFVEMLREMVEMRYLWRETVLLDNARLVKTLGAEPHTPLETALRDALKGQGCPPEAKKTAA
ncbi:NAD-dependent epimerase/dehydratase family protein [Phenylobacterium sp.]|uniref:NmrA family NAD(P)-binding protein n=1 Tax=Phenylobacterium sp. TaxID=1871053 RepID=UPI00272760B5|nr:NAD-dependent epimerase/dehydratase family protein [Phenylobacterium sp.]MDO8379167.1 NAD(P)H-binding protein [Phenylobacterium sp.]